MRVFAERGAGYSMVGYGMVWHGGVRGCDLAAPAAMLSAAVLGEADDRRRRCRCPLIRWDVRVRVGCGRGAGGKHGGCGWDGRSRWVRVGCGWNVNGVRLGCEYDVGC